MQVTFTDKDVKNTRRLGNALNAGELNINDLREFLQGLQRKIDTTSAAPVRIKRSPKKMDRVEFFKRKLRRA